MLTVKGILYDYYIQTTSRCATDLIILLFPLADSTRAVEITNSLAEMVVKDLQSLSMVEDDGFRNFVRTLDPQYKIPNRKTLMEVKLPALYEDCCS